MTISGLLDFSLHVDDGLSVEVAGPTNHVARDLSVLLGENGLNSRNPLPKDKEYYM
jgi:hypothetical protein